MEPRDYPARILLCVSGLHPQIITETLYALAVDRAEPFVPTEVHVITTVEGAERICLKLLEPGTGELWRLCEDHGLDPAGIRFSDETLHLIGEPMAPLADIRSVEENRAAADTIMAVVRELCTRENAAIHASIAGGRKTMGFFLGYALSLLGRAQDRLSHVLVPAPFESHREFYFPPRRPRVLETRDGKPIRTDQACIELAEIPFIRLRDDMPRTVLGGALSFSDTVAMGQDRLQRPSITFDVPASTVWLGDHPVRLSHALFAFYWWLAERRLQGLGPITRDELPPATVARFNELYVRVSGADPDDNRVGRALRNGMDRDEFSYRQSRLHRALIAAVGAQAAEPFRLRRSGTRTRLSYEFPLPPRQIRIKGAYGRSARFDDV